MGREVLSSLLLAAAAAGAAVLALQLVAVWRHRHAAPRAARARPPMSILKPLCGLDEGLEESLELFAALDYPDYEVLLGVRDAGDAAFPVAFRAARRHPSRL